jgi:uncharacterized protein (TIGR02145 family)
MEKKILLIIVAIFFIVLSLEAQVHTTFFDSRDGNTYKIVVIGTQTWMAENLKAIKLNDGNDINLVTDNKPWESLTTPAYCYYSNDPIINKITYGVLYNWYTVNTNKLCPIGWHVPTDREWTILTDFLGGESIAGGKLKETGTTHWTTPDTIATNETGFTALPGGGRPNGNLYSTEGGPTVAYGIIINQSLGLRRYGGNKTDGRSVRCIKD